MVGRPHAQKTHDWHVLSLFHFSFFFLVRNWWEIGFVFFIFFHFYFYFVTLSYLMWGIVLWWGRLRQSESTRITPEGSM